MMGWPLSAPLGALFATVLLLTAGARADTNTYIYPVKSINLTNADQPSWYVQTPSFSSVDDIHPVFGFEASDGSFLTCGKGLEANNLAVMEAFAIKYSSTGGYLWGWQSGISGKNDAANAAIELSSSTYLVVGHRWLGTDPGTYAVRAMWQLDAASGATNWATDNPFVDGAASNGAWEMVTLASADSSVLLAGVSQAPDSVLAEFNFKSYGNVEVGTATVQKMALSALTGTTAPTDSSSVAWTRTFAATYNTAKAARLVGTDKVAVLLYGGSAGVGAGAAAALLNLADGSIVWGPIDYGAEQGEGTDLQVAADGLSFIISGQGARTTGTYYGRMTKVQVSDGARLWTKDFTVGGTDTLIFNECWGASAMADGGFTMTCGAGIEGCPSTLSATDLSNCNAGLGDLRPGAVGPWGAGVWQTNTIRTDSEGTLLWQIVTSYKEPGGPDLGSATWQAASSAGEWVITTRDGGLAVVTDEVNGAGLLRLAASSSSPSPSPSPGSSSPSPSSGASPSPGSASPSSSLALSRSPSLCLIVAFLFLLVQP